MKKKIISICITLFIFFSSTVGVFAQEIGQDSWSVDAQYWLYDVMLQCTVGRNYLAGDWGYAVNDSGSGTFMYQLNGGYDLKLTYNVPAGETVYFRWAIPAYTLPEGYAVTVVSYANYELIDIKEYKNWSIMDNSGNGSFGSLGSITIFEDYTNNSNEVQTVDFYIDNIENDFGIHLIPILCGTKAYFNDVIGGPVNSDSIVNMDLTFIEQTLDNILSNQITSSEFLDSIGEVNAYIGTLTSEVRYNGQVLKSIETVLSSIKTKIDTIDINVADIKLLISYIRADVKDIRSYVNFIMADVDEINITTKQMATTLSEIRDLLNELVNGFDSSKKDNLDSSNQSLSDTVESHNAFESSMFESINLAFEGVPSIDIENDFALLSGFSLVSSVIELFYYSHPGITLMFNIILVFGLTFVLIGRGTRR